MKIYLAYKFTGSNKELLRETIENISRNLESFGHTTFCFFRDVQDWGKITTIRSEIIPIAFNNLDKCDALLMIVSSDEKSTGMGIEAGYAKARNKNILLIKKSNVEVDYLESISDKIITYEEELPSVQALGNLLMDTKEYTEKMRNSYNTIARSYAKKSYNDNFYINQKEYFVDLIGEKGSVLDVGCGGGQDSLYFFKKGFHVNGIDVSDEMVKYAQTNLPDSTFYVGNFVDTDISGVFDGIWCNRVFHHIPLDLQDSFFEKLHKLLVSKGILFLSAELTKEGADVDSWNTGVFPEHEGGDKIKILKKLLTRESFYSLLTKHGFEIIKKDDWGSSGFTEVFARKIL